MSKRLSTYGHLDRAFLSLLKARRGAERDGEPEVATQIEGLIEDAVALRKAIRAAGQWDFYRTKEGV